MVVTTATTMAVTGDGGDAGNNGDGDGNNNDGDYRNGNNQGL